MFWKNKKPREPSYVTDKRVLQNIARNVIDINSYDIEYRNVYEARELQEIYEYIDINILLKLRLKVYFNKNEILFQLFVRLLFRV